MIVCAGERKAKPDVDPSAIALAAIEALNRLEHGVLLVDQDGQIHFANAGAHTLLASRECRIAAGRVHARTGCESTALHQFIVRCAAGNCPDQSSPDACAHRIGEPPLIFQPASPKCAASLNKLLAIFIVDPYATSMPSAAQLRERFGLTPAEAQVAGEIVKGRGLQQCAARLKISATTARTHLKRIFAKTGTDRQAHFVRLGFASHLALRS